MSIETFKEKIAGYTQDCTPFIFVIDFEGNKPFVCALDEAKNHGLYYALNGVTNYDGQLSPRELQLDYSPVDSSEYTDKFSQVIHEINNGNSYLLNLTFPTRVDTNLSLLEIFQVAKAPYKLYWKDQFVVFSPECFVKIEGDEISTYPMKGTIDANEANAEQRLLTDKKETCEHNTIVDLLRNDLSMIAKEVRVTKFRFLQKIKTHKNEILQTSSEIKGKLPNHWRQNFADTFLKLLPAGSICGAPKNKTVEIIKKTEADDRGYYTGVFGVYDGHNLDSSVAIRFIEQRPEGKYFRSGGGITAMSHLEEEYQELIQKIYVPTV